MLMVLTLLLGLTLPTSIGLADGMDHTVTNVGERSFTVSWFTSGAEEGYVMYGTSAGNLGGTAHDDRGQATRDVTHHVTVVGLNPDTTYYYEIVSGGVTYGDSGKPYQADTGVALPFTMPEIVHGAVYRPDGSTPAAGAIVYARIGPSQVLSAVVSSNGAWGLDLGRVRTADYRSPYEYEDDDEVLLDVQAAGHGAVSRTLAIGAAKVGVPDTVLHVDMGTPIETGSADEQASSAGENGGVNWAVIGGIIGGVAVLVLGVWQWRRVRL